MKDWTLITFNYTVQPPIRALVCVLLAVWLKSTNMHTHMHTHTHTHTHTPSLLVAQSGLVSTRLVRRQGLVFVCVCIYLPATQYFYCTKLFTLTLGNLCSNTHTHTHTHTHTNSHTQTHLHAGIHICAQN